MNENDTVSYVFNFGRVPKLVSVESPSLIVSPYFNDKNLAPDIELPTQEWAKGYNLESRQLTDSAFMYSLMGYNAGQDFIFENGFYPRLRHMDERPGRLAASPILLYPGEDADSVTLPFYVDTNYGVRWRSMNEDVIKIEGNVGYVCYPVQKDTTVRVEAWKEDFSKHVYLDVLASRYVYQDLRSDTVCPGDSVLMMRSYARNRGWNYEVVRTDTAQYDTIYRMYLHHHPTYGEVVHRAAVERDSLPYLHGTDTIRQFGLTEVGRYLTVHGCDSVEYVQLDTLYIHRERHFHDTLRGCAGTLRWRNREITAGGDYTDTVFDPYQGGTDSIYHLCADLYATYHDTLYLTLNPDSLPYIYDKDTIRQFGWTTLKALTVKGCDSVTYLYIHRGRHFYDILHTCSDTLHWRSKEITQTGVYSDTVLAPYEDGTDSIYHLHAGVYPAYYDTLCFLVERDSMPYVFGTDTIRQFGFTELHHYHTVHGCDSIIYVQLDTLYIHRTVVIRDTMQGCKGEPLYWRGRKVMYNDYEWVEDPYKGGTDSLFLLTVHRYPTYSELLFVDRYPKSMPYILGTDTIWKFGYTRLEKSTVHGCDSIIHVYLDSYVRRLNLYDTLRTCQGDTLHWRGRKIVRTGLYTDTVFDSYYWGLDSVYHLSADFFTYRDTLTDSCYIEQLPCTVSGRPMLDFGTYTESLVTAAGCDSVREYTLLRRWHHYRVSVRVKGGGAASVTDTTLREDGSLWLAFTASACHQLDSLKIDGRNVPPQSRYELKNLHGDCEVEAVFTENAPVESVLRYEVCGDSLPLVYNGEAYGVGEHEIRLRSAQGCDSVLHLHIQGKENTARLAVVDTIEPPCGASEIAFSYRTETGSPKHLRLAFDPAAQSAGFRDTTLAVASTGRQTVHIALPPTARPDRYGLQLWQADGSGCYAPVEDLAFEVPYPSGIIVQKWNDALAVLSEEYNGGYGFSGYRWYRNGEPLEGETRPYLHVKPYLRSSDTYAVLLERASDGLRLLSCVYRARRAPGEAVLHIAPNPSRGGEEVLVTVEGKPESSGHMEVYDGMGRRIYRCRFEHGTHVLGGIRAPGTYLVRAVSDDGKWTASGKMVVM